MAEPPGHVDETLWPEVYAQRAAKIFVQRVDWEAKKGSDAMVTLTLRVKREDVEVFNDFLNNSAGLILPIGKQ